eukprot:TRINITY_DN11687_c0_g1_i1.p1 TRINITY_DN11687_c0_g1~~TRINITY_DN11687_c0_g1_i1.p1  ORF type:complete len:625 (+),score=92.60 TRINITY_DN11687_c0_g1_i1:83-1876(+)
MEGKSELSISVLDAFRANVSGSQENETLAHKAAIAEVQSSLLQTANQLMAAQAMVADTSAKMENLLFYVSELEHDSHAVVKFQMEELSRQCDTLRADNKRLSDAAFELRNENVGLKQQLSDARADSDAALDEAVDFKQNADEMQAERDAYREIIASLRAQLEQSSAAQTAAILSAIEHPLTYPASVQTDPDQDAAQLRADNLRLANDLSAAKTKCEKWRQRCKEAILEKQRTMHRIETVEAEDTKLRSMLEQDVEALLQKARTQIAEAKSTNAAVSSHVNRARAPVADGTPSALTASPSYSSSATLASMSSAAKYSSPSSLTGPSGTYTSPLNTLAQQRAQQQFTEHRFRAYDDDFLTRTLSDGVMAAAASADRIGQRSPPLSERRKSPPLTQLLVGHAEEESPLPAHASITLGQDNSAFGAVRPRTNTQSRLVAPMYSATRTVPSVPTTIHDAGTDDRTASTTRTGGRLVLPVGVSNSVLGRGLAQQPTTPKRRPSMDKPWEARQPSPPTRRAGVSPPSVARTQSSSPPKRRVSVVAVTSAKRGSVVIDNPAGMAPDQPDFAAMQRARRMSVLAMQSSTPPSRPGQLSGKQQTVRR